MKASCGVTYRPNMSLNQFCSSHQYYWPIYPSHQQHYWLICPSHTNVVGNVLVHRCANTAHVRRSHIC